MSINQYKTIFDLHREVADMILTPEERAKVRIVMVKNPRWAIDIEGPEELKAKVAAAVVARAKQSKN